MNTQHHLFDQNIGTVDLYLRVIVGFALIFSILLTNLDQLALWQTLLPLVGVYLVNSAIVHWDPIYDAFRTIVEAISNKKHRQNRRRSDYQHSRITRIKTHAA